MEFIGIIIVVLLVAVVAMAFTGAVCWTAQKTRAVVGDVKTIGKTIGRKNKIWALEHEFEFVASAKRETYHVPDCKRVKNIDTKDLVGFKTEKEAQLSGKRACGECNP
jgi:hypothetical protein